MSPFDHLLADSIERLKRLKRAAPICGKCGAEQVQLVEWVGLPLAQWKCRVCKHRWEFEPLSINPQPNECL